MMTSCTTQEMPMKKLTNTLLLLSAFCVTACSPKDDELGITREMRTFQTDLESNSESMIYFETSLPKPGQLCLDNKQMHYASTVAKWLYTNKNISLILEGHCDERGASEYNMALGERRALSVKNAIVYEYRRQFNEEMNPGRIDIISFGKESNPVPYVEGMDRSEFLAKNRVVIAKIKDVK
ncbi:MAG: OmpA family protein [Alphaproteobacteria bacterium]|nr:MAG: OmpA family protein [Alphaproteobacteria bacterium]